MSLRAAIAALQETLSAKRRELEALRRTNERLRARTVALALLSRALTEALGVRRAFGAEGGAVADEMQRVAELLQRAQAETAAASAAAYAAEAAAASRGDGSSSAGDDSSAATRAGSGSAGRPRRRELSRLPSGASASSGGDEGDSDARAAAAAAAATAAAPASAVAAAAGLPALRGQELLSQLPHLAEGVGLLHLDNVPPALAAEYRRMSAAEARDRWRALVHEALLLQTDAVEGAQHVASLAECAHRMYRWKNLLLLLNLPAFMPLSVNRYDYNGSLLAGTTDDAPMEHWQTALFERARLTRAQALLVVETHRLCEEHLSHLHAERTDLTRRMATAAGPANAGGGGGGVAGTSAAASAPAGAGAAALGTASNVAQQREPPPQQTGASCAPEQQQHQTAGAEAASPDAGVCAGAGAGVDAGADDALDIADLLEANSGAELATIVLTWIVLPAVFAPPQWARFISSCWPWPAHENACCRLLDEALDNAPHLFAPDGAVAAAAAAVAAAAAGGGVG
ncbi:hypothetical protein Rsub_05821 [Raphidocelis subcapitata]|uniref:Uncharacterized protein n=1 Tax=Raphidocelis subcapitata TaxID=307507 RepID=A0A2V0P7B8_9CHLO|nr:hypothetical protein Rsub_05821 [Raphidocelis subcapitata]|eukprot:GBF92985.1 hypothetical protein Rsub_05821 [Raphidocelis subcapitata]